MSALWFGKLLKTPFGATSAQGRWPSPGARTLWRLTSRTFVEVSPQRRRRERLGRAVYQHDEHHASRAEPNNGGSFRNRRYKKECTCKSRTSHELQRAPGWKIPRIRQRARTKRWSLAEPPSQGWEETPETTRNASGARKVARHFRRSMAWFSRIVSRRCSVPKGAIFPGLRSFQRGHAVTSTCV